MNLAETLFPLLIICGLFALIMLAGIGSSYLWLLFLDQKGRTCPHCGARRSTSIVDSQVVDVRNYVDTTRQPPRLVSEKRYEDYFECRQCGRTWTQTATERTRSPLKQAP